jgi:hypothetical protein
VSHTLFDSGQSVRYLSHARRDLRHAHRDLSHGHRDSSHISFIVVIADFGDALLTFQIVNFSLTLYGKFTL